MICEKCGVNTATTHIRTVVNGVVHEKHLCSLCASAENYSDAKTNNLSQMLSSMLDNTHISLSNDNVTKCNCCGNTFSDIVNSGKCGCSNCYTTFYEQLLPSLKRLHGSIKHIGKKPNLKNYEKASDDNIDELRELLKSLVKEEKYEEAAVIRDKIKNMEREA